VTKWGTISADEETFMTPKKGVFACGDAVIGPSDVTTVMAQAKIAAESIHKYLRGEPVKREYHPIRPTEFIEPIEVEEAPPSRCPMPKLRVEERKSNFKEVELGYTKEMAMAEAKRCLRCDWELVKRLREKGEKK
jgi:heterodisulfide reductase subunit A-like polyferredoxin